MLLLLNTDTSYLTTCLFNDQGALLRLTTYIPTYDTRMGTALWPHGGSFYRTVLQFLLIALYNIVLLFYSVLH